MPITPINIADAAILVATPQGVAYENVELDAEPISMNPWNAGDSYMLSARVSEGILPYAQPEPPPPPPAHHKHHHHSFLRKIGHALKSVHHAISHVVGGVVSGVLGLAKGVIGGVFNLAGLGGLFGQE
jgi:hypothetical protein